MIAIIGAATAAILGGFGSSLGILNASAKGSGVLAEKPNLFGKVLILVALPGSQGVYGLLIGIIILLKAGMIGGGDGVLTATSGYQLLAAGCIMGIAALFSSLLQGKAVSAAIGAVAREESLGGKAIVLSVLIETYAIFGLLVAILIANSVTLS